MRRGSAFPRFVAVGACLLGCGDSATEELSGTTVTSGSESTTSVTTGAGGMGEGGGGGALPALRTEAGFVDLPPQPAVGPSTEGRMFYSFHPADTQPEKAPLLVFFNGGPGSATTRVLALYGTGPVTLDASGPLDQAPQPHPHSYTRFANLLYLDARHSGFSYGVGGPLTCTDEHGAYIGDAGDFILATLHFLDEHPALISSRVVLVGESYGGTRASIMLYALQHYAPEVDDPFPVVTERLPWLKARMQAHLDRVHPARAGQLHSPDEVAQQFGWAALIQPSLIGQTQAELQAEELVADPDFSNYNANPSTYSGYDVRMPKSDEADLEARADNAIMDPARLEAILGVAPAEVPGLRASERGDAFMPGASMDRAAREVKLRAELGELPQTDSYWLPWSRHCNRFLGNVDITGNMFLRMLPRTQTLITNARWDAVVYTEALPSIFSELGVLTTVDTAAPVGAQRPGELVISLKQPVRVRFPTYEAGHEVTIRAGREFAEDLEAWLAASGAL